MGPHCDDDRTLPEQRRVEQRLAGGGGTDHQIRRPERVRGLVRSRPDPPRARDRVGFACRRRRWGARDDRDRGGLGQRPERGEVPGRLRSRAEDDHARRPGQEPAHRGKRHGGRTQGRERRPVDQRRGPQRGRVEDHVQRVDPGQPPRGVPGRDRGELHARVRRGFGRHQKQRPVPEGHLAAGHGGGGVEPVAQRLLHGCDRVRVREQGWNVGGVEVTQCPHRSTNPGVIGSSGSITNVCSPVGYAMPVMTGTTSAPVA